MEKVYHTTSNEASKLLKRKPSPRCDSYYCATLWVLISSCTLGTMLTSIIETCRFWKKTLSNVTFTRTWRCCWEIKSHWIIQSQDMPRWEPFFVFMCYLLFFFLDTILLNLVLFIDMLQQMHLSYNEKVCSTNG